MARERLYRNNAEKQAAYRGRHSHEQRPRQQLLATLGQELHARLREAIAVGTNRVPATVLGKRSDETLINLMRYVRGDWPPEEEKEL